MIINGQRGEWGCAAPERMGLRGGRSAKPRRKAAAGRGDEPAAGLGDIPEMALATRRVRKYSRAAALRKPTPGCERAPVAVEAVARTRIVLLLVEELVDLASEGGPPHMAAWRMSLCHVRQIAMYLCRVALSMRYRDIAAGLGRDRSTVMHNCEVVEDRRDDKAYDGFIDRCERCVAAIFRTGEGQDGRA